MQEIEAARREDRVEGGRAGHFRPQRGLHPVGGQVGQQLAVGDAGRVHDAAYRRCARIIALHEEGLERRGRPDVQHRDLDGDAAGLQLPYRLDLVPRGLVERVGVPVAARRQRRPARQDHSARAAVGEPARGEQPEGTHATGDQIRRVRAAAQGLPVRLAGGVVGQRRQHLFGQLAVAQRQNGLRRGAQQLGKHVGGPGVPVLGEVDQPAPQLRLLGPDHAGDAPQAALPHSVAGAGFAHATGDDPQPRLLAAFPRGEPTHDVRDLRGQPRRARQVVLVGVGGGHKDHRRGVPLVDDLVAGRRQRTGELFPLGTEHGHGEAGSAFGALRRGPGLPVQRVGHVAGVRHRRGRLRGTGLHVDIAQTADVQPCAAVGHRHVDQQIVSGVRASQHGDREVGAGELAGHRHALHSGGYQQTFVGDVGQARDLHRRVEHRHRQPARLGVGEGDLGAHLVAIGPAGCDRPREGLAFHTPFGL